MPIQIPAGISVDIARHIIKFIWKGRGPRVAKMISIKNKLGVSILPNVKAHYIAPVIRTVGDSGSG